MAVVSVGCRASNCVAPTGLVGTEYTDRAMRGWDAGSVLRVAGIPEGHQQALSILEDRAVGDVGQTALVEMKPAADLKPNVSCNGREARWHTTQGPMLSLGSGCGRASGHDKSRSANGVKMMGIRISGCDHQRQWKGQALDGMVNEALHKLVRTLRIGSPREWKPGAKVEKKGRRKRRHSNSQSSPGKRAEKLTFAWNPASGPRKGGEGVEDLLQGLTGAQCLSDGSLQLNMTLLVAGFIIGPSGASIHGIIEKTGARISSWTQHSGQHDKRNTRVFVIKGTAVQMSHAVKIVLKAICRYKELAEGGYLGRLVDSVQTIEGVEFLYRPPPKDKVPYAASVDRTGKKKLQRDYFCFSVEKSGGIGELPTVPDEIACHKTA